MARPADPRKEQGWLRHFRRCQRSRLTVREYCDRHQLSEPSFYSWRRTLQQRGLLADAAAPDGPRPHDDARVAAPLFLPVSVAQADATAQRIEIVLPDGLCVRIGAGFDAATLRQLLALLRGQSC